VKDILQVERRDDPQEQEKDREKIAALWREYEAQGGCTCSTCRRSFVSSYE
jgi:hypothetical protein